MTAIVHTARVAQDPELVKTHRAFREAGIKSFQHARDQELSAIADHVERAGEFAEKLEAAFIIIETVVKRSENNVVAVLESAIEYKEKYDADRTVPDEARQLLLLQKATCNCPACQGGTSTRQLRKAWEHGLEKRISEYGRYVDELIMPLTRTIAEIEMHLDWSIRKGFFERYDDTPKALTSMIAYFRDTGSRNPTKVLDTVEERSKLDEFVRHIRNYLDELQRKIEDHTAETPAAKLSSLAKTNIDKLDAALDLAQRTLTKINDPKRVILAYVFQRFEANDAEQSEKLERQLRLQGSTITEAALKTLRSEGLISKERVQDVRELWPASTKHIGERKHAEREMKVEPEGGRRSERELIEISKRLEPYVPDYSARTKLAKTISAEAAEAVPEFLTAAVGETMARDVLTANRSLFELCDSNNAEFSRFIDNLTRLQGVIVSLIQNDRLDARDFSSPEALQRFMLREAEAQRGQAELVKIKTALTEAGFDAEASLVAMQQGFFFGGAYFKGNRAAAEDTIIRNMSRGIENYSLVKDRLRKALRKLVSNGAVEDTPAMSLNIHIDGDTKVHAALRSAVHWVLAHPPEDGKVKVI